MSKRISQEEFIHRIEEHYPNEQFEIIEYTTMSNPCKIKCLSCGKILQYPQAKNFLIKGKKAGCSDCFGAEAKRKNNLTKLESKYDILNITRENGTLRYTCRCKRCGRESTHQMISFLENSCRCESAGNYWTEQEILDYLKKEYGTEYTLLSPYESVNKKSLIKHSCGFVWSTTLAHILYNHTGCPRCCHKQSKGCKIIAKELEQLQIPFKIEEPLNNSLQRFDFYIEYNNQKYAIEYNGEQHYKYNPFFHGHDIEIFYKYQERDKRKAQYCLDNGIQLIIIPYTFSNDEIRSYINNLFSSSTTSSMNVGSSESK